MASSLLLKELTDVLMSRRPAGMSSPDAELWIRGHVEGFAVALMTHFQPWFTTEDPAAKNKPEKAPIGGLNSRAAQQLAAELSMLHSDMESLFFKRTLTMVSAFLVALDANRKIDKADQQRLSSRVLGEQWWIDSALNDTERKAIPWGDATWWLPMIRDAVAADLVDPGGYGADAGLQSMDDNEVWGRFDEIDNIIGVSRPSPRLAKVKAEGENITEDDLAKLPPAWPVELFLKRWPAGARSKATDHLVPSGELDVVPLDKAVQAIAEQLDWWDRATEVYDAAQMGLEILIHHELERMRASRSADLMLDDAEWWLTQYPPSTSSSHARFKDDVAALRERYEHAVASM